MKIRYNREVNILTIQVTETPADHAEESDGVITHFSVAGKPVMLEIQGGREFLLVQTRIKDSITTNHER